ncbi:hypothetical protein D9758_008280 [Tetrapyrgos nigripes]|uniref:F-box domain-containing protein n=1 Tax=Tetrapyrgos nigripes TaxID=182062 RepID=A0A8H5LGS1_9AGAR|nr:hypothetical protein D9758_008280 [Tetrapyrgos nigripes]
MIPTAPVLSKLPFAVPPSTPSETFELLSSKNKPATKEQEVELNENFIQLSRVREALETEESTSLLKVLQHVTSTNLSSTPSPLQLQEAIHRFRNHVDALHSLIQNLPLRRFPFEILSEIFLFAIAPPKWDDLDICRWDTIKAHDMLYQITSRTGPYALLQVSLTWRAVALATPRLWTSIIITKESLLPIITGIESATPFLNPRNAIEVFRHRVACSGTCLLLDISLQKRGELPIPTCEALLEEIMSVAPRWGSIRLDLFQYAPDLPVDLLSRQFQTTHFPLLRSIYLQWNYFELAPFGDTFVPANMPNLRSVTWKRLLTFRDPVHIFPAKLAWAQLTDLEIEIRDGDLPMLLNACPKLTKLAYWFYDPMYAGVWDGSEVDPTHTHESLECLILRGLRWGGSLTAALEKRPALQHFLKEFYLPNFRELTVEGCGVHSPDLRTWMADLPSSISAFLKNCRPRNFERLVIDGVYLDDRFVDMLETLSKTTPGFKHLLLGIDDLVPVDSDITFFTSDAYLLQPQIKRMLDLFTVPGDLGEGRLSEEVYNRTMEFKFPCLEFLSLAFRDLRVPGSVSGFAIEDLEEMARSRRNALAASAAASTLNTTSTISVARRFTFMLDWSRYNCEPWFENFGVGRIKELEDEYLRVHIPQRNLRASQDIFGRSQVVYAA